MEVSQVFLSISIIKIEDHLLEKDRIFLGKRDGVKINLIILVNI